MKSVRFILIVSLFLPFSILKAEEKKTCSIGATELSEIKEYSLCQGTAELTACGLLGATAGGLLITEASRRQLKKQITQTSLRNLDEAAANFFNENMAKRKSLLAEIRKKEKIYMDYMIANGSDVVPKSTLEHLGNSEDHNLGVSRKDTPDFKKNAKLSKAEADQLKKQIYALRKQTEAIENKITSLFGNVLDIEKFEELPAQAKEKIKLVAQKLKDEIGKMIEKGVPVKEMAAAVASKTGLGAAATTIIASALTNAKKSVEALRAKKYSNKIKALKKKLGVKNLRSPKAAKNFKKLAKLPKLGSGAGRAGLMAFGGIGLAAYLMTEAIPGGHCGGDMAGEYTHQTRAFIGSCSLEPALDANTLEFLDLTQEQQEKLLNHHGKICRYYELLHKKLFSNYKLKTLSCSGRDTIVTYSLEGSSETKRLKIRAGKNGHIYSLNWENLKSGGSPSMSIPKHVKLDPSHKPETAVNSFISEDYNMAKLFAGEAVRCCNSTEDDLCNQNFPENQSQKSKKSNSTYVN